MGISQVDETLLLPRKITGKRPDEEITGAWECRLACGHMVWCAVEPRMDEIICGQCLHLLVEQGRQLQERQTRPVR